MRATIHALGHGLAPCRRCHLPVAPPPPSMLHRELFHVSRCPHCRIVGPHPVEHEELLHTRRTALLGAALLGGILALLLVAPFEKLAGF